jgi:hypothetical protein
MSIVFLLHELDRREYSRARGPRGVVSWVELVDQSSDGFTAESISLGSRRSAAIKAPELPRHACYLLRARHANDRTRLLVDAYDRRAAKHIFR